MDKVTLAAKFAALDEVYAPKVVAELNDQYVKVVKIRGPYPWHYHEDEDELFLVLEGAITIRFRDGEVGLGPGEFLIVPRGVEHSPDADETASVVMFEPKTTRNTGNIDHPLTIEPDALERI